MRIARAGGRREGAWRRGFLATSASLAAVVAAPALAQIAPGLSGSSSNITFTDRGEAFRTLKAFANCYARRNTSQALELIATEPASRDEAETYRRLFRRNNIACVSEGDRISMPMAWVRGAIAEGLYTSGIALPPQLIQSAPAPGDVRTLSEVARCVTATRRDRVQALVDGTSPGTRAEFEALSRLTDEIFACIPESVQVRRFDPTQIRYRLAEALLRMPVAAD